MEGPCASTAVTNNPRVGASAAAAVTGREAAEAEEGAVAITIDLKRYSTPNSLLKMLSLFLLEIFGSSERSDLARARDGDQLAGLMWYQ